jgi:hypothetical protein
MLFLTNGKTWQSVVISLSTTGLLFALMFIGYMLMENRKRAIKGMGTVVMIFAFLIYVEDVIFDSLLADVLRYGAVQLSVDNLQWLFRILLGGISTVGDGLAVAMIIGLPVLKNIVGAAINTSTDTEPVKRYTEPKSIHYHKLPKRESKEEHTTTVETPDPTDLPSFLSRHKR